MVAATTTLLNRSGMVAPIDLFVEMDMLSPEDFNDWRAGRVRALEMVLRGSLPKLNRVLRILRLHAADSRLKRSRTAYVHPGKHSKVVLQFSGSRDPTAEE